MKILQLSVALLALLLATTVAQDDTNTADVGEAVGDALDEDALDEDDDSDFIADCDISGTLLAIDINKPPKGVTCAKGVCILKKIVTEIAAFRQRRPLPKGWSLRLDIRVKSSFSTKMRYQIVFRQFQCVVKRYKVTEG